MRKILSVILALVMMTSAFSLCAYAKTSEEADTHLQYNADGTFRIMQISDMQDYAPMEIITKRLLRKALDDHPVDLIVLTGDNISSSTLTKWWATWAIREFMDIFEEYGIPVAMTFGNHDDENTLADKAYQVSVYEQYDCFIGCAGEDLGDTNLCTYYVPIYSSTDKYEMVNNIWMIDSGTYNTENDLGGYAAVTKAQIEWYKNASADLERHFGRKIPSLMFQHIIVPQIWDALEECDENADCAKVWHGGKCYTLPEGTRGTLGEGPCPPNYDNGQFDAVLERSDVMAMFFGHDHTNTFELEYKGVGLINTAGAGFNSYNSDDAGVRIITLNEEEPDTFETESFGYFDLFDYDDDEARYLYKMASETTEDGKTHFAAFFKFIFTFMINRILGVFGK